MEGAWPPLQNKPNHCWIAVLDAHRAAGAGGGCGPWSGGEGPPRPGAAQLVQDGRDLIALPVPETNLLWCDLHVREVNRENGKQKTQTIRVANEKNGVHQGERWSNGLEFDYPNAESIDCRPLGLASGGGADNDPMGEADQSVRVAYLPSMSGSLINCLDSGAVQVRLGEGCTFAFLLVNRCCVLLLEDPDDHLEILCHQRSYNLLTDVALGTGSQVIGPSHPKVILNEHFHYLQEAMPNLVGLVIVDRLAREFSASDLLPVVQWQRREIDNDLCFPDGLQ
jgi:hypothetical protein